METEINKRKKYESLSHGLGITGLILGILTLLVSFIPCFGMYAFFFGILAIFISVIGLAIAFIHKHPKGLLIGALITSLIGCGIGYSQYAALTSIADNPEEFFKDFEEEVLNENSEIETIEEVESKPDSNEERMLALDKFALKDFWRVVEYKNYNSEMEWTLKQRNLSPHFWESIKRRRASGIMWDYQISYRYEGWDSWTDNVTLTYYFNNEDVLINYDFFSFGDQVKGIITSYGNSEKDKKNSAIKAAQDAMKASTKAYEEELEAQKEIDMLDDNIYFKINVDNLRVRKSPELDSDKIENLEVGISVQYLNEKSTKRATVTIKDNEITEFWYKIKTPSGNIGWIHGCCFDKN